MAGSRNKFELSSEFWCINCGKKGIPIMRKRSRRREPGHRKAMYCIYCKTIINHVETRNETEAKQFQENFEEGKYAEEAERSIAYAQQRKRMNNELNPPDDVWVDYPLPWVEGRCIPEKRLIHDGEHWVMQYRYPKPDMEKTDEKDEDI